MVIKYTESHREFIEGVLPDYEMILKRIRSNGIPSCYEDICIASHCFE